MNLATLTAGMGSPLLAPRGLPITPRQPPPGAHAADTQVMHRARVMRVLALLFGLTVLGVAIMAAAFYPSIASGDQASADVARNIGFGAGVLALSTAALTVFFRWYAPLTAPLYAVTSGVFMAGLALGLEVRFPGIALQSLLVTLVVFVTLWGLHGAGLIQVGRRLMILTYTATAAIALVYLLSFLFWLAGARLPLIHEAGIGGILWSGFIVVVASLNLLLDFERIARLEGQLQPRYMPWFVGLGLMVTLVWLYISVLRLLARLRR